MVFVKFGNVFRVDLPTKAFFYDYVQLWINLASEAIRYRVSRLYSLLNPIGNQSTNPTESEIPHPPRCASTGPANTHCAAVYGTWTHQNAQTSTSAGAQE